MKKLLSLLILFLFALSAQATDYYVTVAGIDDIGRDGSVGSPWRTVHYAAGRISAGAHVIHVGAGTFTENLQITLALGVDVDGEGETSVLEVTHNGNAMVMESASEGTDGSHTITDIKMDGNLTSFMLIRVYRRNNVIIHNCTFIDSDAIGVYFRGGTAEPTTYATGNQFYDNVITNCAGVTAGTPQGALVMGGQSGMIVHDNVITVSERGVNLEGYGSKYTGDGYMKGLQFYNNTVTVPPIQAGQTWDFALEFFNSRGGIDFYNNTIQGTLDFAGEVNNAGVTDGGAYGYALKIYDNTFGAATMHTLEESGVDIERGAHGGVYIMRNKFQNLTFPIRFMMQTGELTEDIYMFYNIFQNIGISGNSTGYISLGHSTTASSWDDIHFYNNVIYENGPGTPQYGITVRTRGTATDIVIRNNIIVGFTSAPIQVLESTITSGLIIEKNIFYNNGNSNNPLFSASTIGSDSTIWPKYKVDPLFVSSTNFHLTGTSPAINLGYDMNAAYNTLDYDSVTVHATTPEIGAYEYSAALPAVPPTVTTTAPTGISSSAATSGGNVTDNGGGTISARGVCWSSSSNPPTTSDSKTTDAPGTGSYVSNIGPLNANTLYYLRAYATNEAGTSYGSLHIFNTPSYSIVVF